MAKSDDLLLNQKDEPRFSFLRNSNRKVKVIDGDKLSKVALGSARSPEIRTPPPRRFGIPCCKTASVDESSQASNLDLGASSSSRDLMDSTRHITAPNQQQHQNRRTKMNDAPAPDVKRSRSNTTPVSRLSKQKEEIARPPKYTTSLVGKTVTNTTPESKQLKHPDGSAKNSTISTIRASVTSVKKKENPQPPKNLTALVENRGTNTILASEQGFQKNKIAQASKDPVEVIKNIGTKRTVASKHVDKKETAQPRKDPAQSVKNTVTGKIPASGHSMLKNKTTQSPKDSALLVRKSKDTSTNSVWKSSEKLEISQPSKGTSGLVRKTRRLRALPSNLVSQELKSIAAQLFRQDKSTYHHIVWEGFDEGIVPFEMSCPLCECDLAEDPEYDPDVEHLNPTENAVLSCGHAFHSLCLQMATTEDNCRDPPCIICLSLS